MSTGGTQDECRVVHIFTFDSVPTLSNGESIADVLELGRYGIHSGGGIMEDARAVSFPKRRIQIRRANAEKVYLDVEPSVWRTNDGYGQLHLRQWMDQSPEEISEILELLCHERHEYLIDGKELKAWFSELIGARDEYPRLLQDVLQIVYFPRPKPGDFLFGDGSPNLSTLQLIYRSRKADLTTTGVIRMPEELNRNKESFCVHGRGVIVLGGHQNSTADALTMTSIELLVSMSRARVIRRELKQKLDEAERSEKWNSQSFLDSVARVSRRKHLDLEVGVRSYSDGLHMPEIVMDCFRESYRDSLRLDDILESSTSLVAALESVSRASLADVRLDAARRAERRQRKWGLLVGLGSGVLVPISMLFSYYSVNSQVQSPSGVSIFSWQQYWIPWAAAGAVILIVCVMTIVNYRKNGLED